MSKYSGRPWKYENEWDTICNILSSSNCHRTAAIKFVSLTLTILHFIMCSFSCMGGIANTFVIITWYIDFLHILLFTVSWSSLVLRGHWTFLARSFCTVLARSLITGTVMPEQKQRTLLQLVFFRCALHSSPNGQIVHCISGCWHMASRRTRQSRPAHQINHVIDPEAALKL